MKKNLLNSREEEGRREGEWAALYGRAMFSLAGYPFENVACNRGTVEGRKEGRKEEGSMNLGRRSLLPSLLFSLSPSLARDYSDVMLMRMATKEISRRRRRGRKEDGGEKRGERERWVGGHPHHLFYLPRALLEVAMQ